LVPLGEACRRSARARSVEVADQELGWGLAAPGEGDRGLLLGPLLAGGPVPGPVRQDPDSEEVGRLLLLQQTLPGPKGNADCAARAA